MHVSSPTSSWQFSLRSLLIACVWVGAASYLLWYVTWCLNVLLLILLTLTMWSVGSALDARHPRIDRRAYAGLAAFSLCLLVAIPAHFFTAGKEFELFEPEVRRQTKAFQSELLADDRFREVGTYYPLSSHRLYVSGYVRTKEEYDDVMQLIAKYEQRLPLVVGYVLIVDPEKDDVKNSHDP